MRRLALLTLSFSDPIALYGVGHLPMLQLRQALAGRRFIRRLERLARRAEQGVGVISRALDAAAAGFILLVEAVLCGRPKCRRLCASVGHQRVPVEAPAVASVP